MVASEEFIVEDATDDDVDCIQAMLRSRPEGDNGRWMPTAGCHLFVARDALGVAAWLMLRVDTDARAVTADQIEGWWAAGKPTLRSIRAMRFLGNVLHEKADDLGFDVYCVVADDNVRHGKVLTGHFGYHPESRVFRRAPKGRA